MNILLLISALAAPAADDQAIVVTASRTPVAAADSAASTTSFDQEALDDLSLPALPDLLRLAPGVSVATTGPRGTQTQVRIRGAEANHTLIFVDGIRFNDPAAGNEARFELLTSDSLSRVEIVRGPQSALWGSEALGGVIAAETPDPLSGGGFEGQAEYGSLDSSRLSGRYAVRAGDVGVMASAGWLRSDGVDSFGAPGGDRDGFDNVAASLKLEARPSDALTLGVVGHWIQATNRYDGFDPITFVRADTLDETKNRIGAVRGWAAGRWGGWSLDAGLSYLDSTNRNLLAGAPLNRTLGNRLTFDAQLSRQLGGHRFTAAVEHEDENFHARDTFFGAADQDRSRHLTAIAGEWRADWSPAIVTDLALRHDAFSAFADATTFRASLLVRPVRNLRLHAAYGEGIAQPTFYDLYGFFPGAFVGNSTLKPERSRGWEAGAGWQDGHFSLDATFFSARLQDEIVDATDPATFFPTTVNAAGTSRRKGIELSAGWHQGRSFNLSANYTWLDADQQVAAGGPRTREIRRPRNGFNLAAYGEAGRLRWGATLAYVGSRQDEDFDLFPAPTVTLRPYTLASANLGWRVLPQLELYARAENAFDAHYEDVVGYHTPGRTLYAGLRVAFGH